MPDSNHRARDTVGIRSVSKELASMRRALSAIDMSALSHQPFRPREEAVQKRARRVLSESQCRRCQTTEAPLVKRKHLSPRRRGGIRKMAIDWLEKALTGKVVWVGRCEPGAHLVTMLITAVRYALCSLTCFLRESRQHTATTNSHARQECRQQKRQANFAIRERLERPMRL